MKTTCKYFYIHKWGEPSIEPGESGTIENEPQCKIKKGCNMVLCNGDLELCELERIGLPKRITEQIRNKMKTAEEWNEIYGNICFNDKAVSGQLLPNPQNIKFIQSVQQDALTEHDKEIEAVIDEMIEKCKRIRFALVEKNNFGTDFACEVGYNTALNELKNKLGMK